MQDDFGEHTFGEHRATRLRGLVQVRDRRFYKLVFWGGGLGAAEAFIRGYWQTPDLTTLLRVLARNRAAIEQLDRGVTRLVKPIHRIGHAIKRNTIQGSRRNILAHYDLSNEFFASFLDPTMTYSSGIFASPAATMEQASYFKFNRLCHHLALSPSDHLLEIGTGWGGLAIYVARKFGCRVTTTTISIEQYQFAKAKVAEAGLSSQVTVLKEDYRKLKGNFDKLVSVEMIEAVGREYLGTYIAKCDSLLKPGGRFALQMITIPVEREQAYHDNVDFIQRYIFPGGCLPSLESFLEAVSQRSCLSLFRVDELGSHYAETLARWRGRFEENIEQIHALGMTEDIIRTWRYYFAYCEAGFLEEMIGLKQLLLLKPSA